MGFFRFRRSMSIIPGVRLNFGKRGASVSLGPRGAKMTIGPTGTRVTAGLPGTGISYTEKLGAHHEVVHQQDEPHAGSTPDIPAPPANSGFASLGWIVAAILLVLLIAALS